MHRRALPALAAMPTAVRAQAAWAPNRPLRFVVPYAAGGSTDVATRLLAERMGETLGQPVVVENRGGSGGNIGAEAVARAAPDGHTLLMGATGLMTTNVHIYPAMPFDPVRDLAPVSMAYSTDLVIVAHAGVPARTIAELVALAKARPGDLAFGSGGHGNSSHTAAELFALAADVVLTHVPYRGTGPATNDLVAGTIQLMWTQLAPTLGQIRDGRIRALAVTGPRRHPLMPEVPTIAEAGFAEAQATSWGAVFATAGTPAPAIARLHDAVREALARPSVSQRMAAAGVDGLASTPDELAAFLRAETEKWGRVVRRARITVN